MCLGFSRETLSVASIFKLVESLSQAAALRVLWLAVADAPVVGSRARRCAAPSPSVPAPSLRPRLVQRDVQHAMCLGC